MKLRNPNNPGGIRATLKQWRAATRPLKNPYMKISRAAIKDTFPE